MASPSTPHTSHLTPHGAPPVIAVDGPSGVGKDTLIRYAAEKLKDDPRYYYPDTDAGRQAYLDDSTAALENET